MTQSNPHLKLPVMPLPPEPPPENDFPCCSQPAPSCCKSGSSDLLTASEVKVLTETASKVAYALGRKDAGEEIAEAMQAYVANYPEDIFPPDGTSTDCIAAKAMRHAYPNAARIALEISAQAPGAVSDATSGVPGHQEVSEAVRSPQEPCECSCYKLPRWPDGLLRHHPDCPNTVCPDCGLTDDHEGGCPQTGEAPQPGAPG